MNFAKLFFGLILLTACSSGPPPAGKPIEQTSATAKTIIVPVQNSKMRIQYDPAASPVVATITFAEFKDRVLYINKDVIPALQRATGCRSAAQRVPDDRVLVNIGRTTVPLAC